MAAKTVNTHVLPKPRELTKNETFTSFRNWASTLRYRLSLNPDFAPFLNMTWKKKSATDPNRGLTNDPETVPEAKRLTAETKIQNLESMLEQVASFAPVISYNTITKMATSLEDIWQRLRQHYNFRVTGAHFLDLAMIKQDADEYPEDLFQRLTAFFEDSLLTTTSGISHHGENTTEDEEMTPTLENTIVLIWLQLLHPGLPQLVKQKYGSELRNKTLASLKPGVSQALSSLLDELNSIEDSKVMRAGATSQFNTKRSFPFKKSSRPFKSCTLCKKMGKASYNTHNITECRILTSNDRQLMQKYALARLLQEDDDDDPNINDDHIQDSDFVDEALIDDPATRLITMATRRVRIAPSPQLNMYYNQFPVTLVLDTGATASLVKASIAKQIGLHIKPATQAVHQADGKSASRVQGEVDCFLTRGEQTYKLNALVVDDLDCSILAGMPFHEDNDIACRPAKKQIVIKGSEIITYGHTQVHSDHSVRRAQVHIVRGLAKDTVVMPDEYIEVKLPTPETDELWALEPRYDCQMAQGMKPDKQWPFPQLVQSVGDTVRLTNTTAEPILVPKNDHFCHVTRVMDQSSFKKHTPPELPTSTLAYKTSSTPHSSAVHVDPDHILPHKMRQQFKDVNLEFDDVFNPSVSRYNGASGNIQGTVHMGPVLPPQRKGRLPQYNRGKLIDLQSKFDQLEDSGVFARPEDLGITVEYLNPSFLVQKPNGGSRLVTSFGEVAQYSKPQPSLLPSVDDTLRAIASWEYIIISDLLKSFYQIPLAKDSMKFCGVATPFKGIRVYTRCAIGMPGSETALEELMCRVLGNLIQEGKVVKLADDLYCGGDSPQEALNNWRDVLIALKNNNLRLSAAKTKICPKTATILGWIWSQGKLRASPHRISVLTAVKPPSTVKSMRSFIGAFKVLSRVLKGYANILHPLEQAIPGMQSADPIQWTDELHSSFSDAQKALTATREITLPRPADTLWIVTDASVKTPGIAATMYILRNNELKLAGFFNAQVKKHQITWLPCGLEALCIGTAISHFAPYIIQSHHPVQVLTDSRPCVLAYQKLCRGEFSTSSRVTSFLSTLSRYQARLGHVAGAANLPSDYASCNPLECKDQQCHGHSWT